MIHLVVCFLSKPETAAVFCLALLHSAEPSAAFAESTASSCSSSILTEVTAMRAVSQPSKRARTTVSTVGMDEEQPGAVLSADAALDSQSNNARQKTAGRGRGAAKHDLVSEPTTKRRLHQTSGLPLARNVAHSYGQQHQRQKDITARIHTIHSITCDVSQGLQ